MKALIEKNSGDATKEFAALNTKLNELEESLSAKIDAIDARYNDLTAAYEAADVALEAKLSAEDKKLAETIDALHTDMTTRLESIENQKVALETSSAEVAKLYEAIGKKADAEEVNSKIAGIQTTISELTAKVDAIKTDWSTEIQTAIQEYVASNKIATSADITSAVSTLETTINGKLANYVTIAKFEEIFGENGVKFTELETVVSTLM